MAALLVIGSMGSIGSMGNYLLALYPVSSLYPFYHTPPITALKIMRLFVTLSLPDPSTTLALRSG